MPGEKWQLRVNGHKVVGSVDDILYEFCHQEPAIAYWAAKGRIENIQDVELD